MRKHMGKSFIAQLDCDGGGTTIGMITMLARIWSGSTVWLRLDRHNKQPVELKFDYLGNADDRFQYAITGAESASDYAGAALGVGVNGYIGLYRQGKVDNRWTIHYNDDEQVEDFSLLDSKGNPVGVTRVPFLEPGNTPDYVQHNTLVYLSTREDNVARFYLDSIQVSE